MAGATTPLDPVIEIEACVLGSMILDNSAVDLVRHKLVNVTFLRHPHNLIYRAILDLRDKQAPVDLVTLRDELVRRDQIQRIGGVDYLIACVDGVPSSANADYYADRVLEAAAKRSLAEAARKVGHDAGNGVGIKDAVDAAGRLLAGVQAMIPAQDMVQANQAVNHALAGLQDAFGERGTVPGGTSTGFWDLDAEIGDLRPGHVYIVAGRPGMGKTSWAAAVTAYVAGVLGRPVVFFSLEMTRSDIVLLLLCQHARVSEVALNRGRATPDDLQRLLASAGEVAKWPLTVCSTPALTSAQVLGRIRATFPATKPQPGLVVIDYLQRMRPNFDRGGRSDLRQDTTAISRECAAAGVSLGVPILMLSQLTREVDKREDKRPVISDLRESGAIEEDATGIFFLYRDEYYNPKDSQWPGICELRVAKNRYGPSGATVNLRFDAAYRRFDNTDPYGGPV